MTRRSRRSVCEGRRRKKITAITKESIIVWTLKTKSLLPSLYKREEFPLLGTLFLSLNRQRGVRGDFYNNRSFQLGLISK
jgi:hypothetical protein